MYTSIVNENVKIIHRDGDRVIISIGLLQEYDPTIKTLKIIKNSGKIVFINAASIDKLEVQE